MRGDVTTSWISLRCIQATTLKFIEYLPRSSEQGIMQFEHEQRYEYKY